MVSSLPGSWMEKMYFPSPWGRRSKVSRNAFLNKTGSRWAKASCSVTMRTSSPLKVLQ